jgi:hypothetical protein
MTSPSEKVTIELNPREQRLYDGLRGRVVGEGSGRSSGAGDLLLLLPDLTVLLLRLMRDRRVPPGPKWVAALGVGYVLSPIDLMPSLLLGPIGLVDDLLVVSAALSRPTRSRPSSAPPTGPRSCSAAASATCGAPCWPA